MATNLGSGRRLAQISAHLRPADARTQPGAVLRPTSTEARQLLDSKIADACAAADLVRSGDVVTVAGFVGCSCPDLLLEALRARFDATGLPRDLTLLYVASASDGKGRGVDRLSADGLVSKLLYAWTGNAPGFVKLVQQNKVQAWNLPLGVVSHMIRDVAAGRAGPITRIGLNTFVDPRNTGGRLNDATKDQLVEVVHVGGRELLWYKAPPKIHIALLRGTTADTDGNISFEKEPVLLDQLYQAMAARNSGGKVVVQVERVVAAGSLPPRGVHIPGVLVDKVVVAPEWHHPHTFGIPRYDGSLTGEVLAPAGCTPELDLGDAASRRVIAHRAMLEIEPGVRVVNLGVGMPEADNR